MSLTLQYALDLYRLARRAETAEPGPVRPAAHPPVPGTHEARLLHALRAGLRFRGRPRRAEAGPREEARANKREGRQHPAGQPGPARPPYRDGCGGQA